MLHYPPAKINQAAVNRRLSVAPMMDWTDRHFRAVLRILSANALLYTEMVTTGALLHGNADRFLAHGADNPCALQLGGSDPGALARAAILGEQAGYAEINLNCGCPSDRVQEGGIGACLMADAALVADCWQAMAEAVSVPVTIKSRIGIDDRDSFEFFAGFIETLYRRGCRVFIVHARKAILHGLSPKENRE
ncbi:MAG: tRNA dihydrouridine(20/20a) synthase DusA, partial [Anaerolineae bacterium]|nr:tRNA dihydrouridine(20/20a) synthase DusA [Anaerolineae bacterium]